MTGASWGPGEIYFVQPFTGMWFLVDGHICLVGPDLQVHNLPALAMEEHLHGAATNFTINSEPLRRLGGVHHEFEGLPTKWTLDFF